MLAYSNTRRGHHYLVTVERTLVAFSQLSCRASHLGLSLQRQSPVNKQIAGSAWRAKGTCQVALFVFGCLKLRWHACYSDRQPLKYSIY